MQIMQAQRKLFFAMRVVRVGVYKSNSLKTKKVNPLFCISLSSLEFTGKARTS